VLQHVEADEAAQKVAEISKKNARMVQAAAIAEKLASQSDFDLSKAAAELYKQELPPRVKALLLRSMGMNTLADMVLEEYLPEGDSQGPANAW
jgi:hypothetical protein